MNDDNIDDLVKAYTAQINGLVKTRKAAQQSAPIAEIDILRAKVKQAAQDLNKSNKETLSHKAALERIAHKMFMSIGYTDNDSITMKNSIMTYASKNQIEQINAIFDETVCFYMHKLTELNEELTQRIEQADADLEAAYEEIDELKGE